MSDIILQIEDNIFINVERTGANIIVEDNYQRFFGIINSDTHTSTFTNIPVDIELYTMDSVNDSFTIFADGLKYYYNENVQVYSDQVKIIGNVFSFLYEITRLEIIFRNKLILK